MALSVPPPPLRATWDRTLPNPAALVVNGMEGRRSSSLLQHHISSHHFMTPAADVTRRDNPIPYIAPLTEEDKAGGGTDGDQGYVREHQDPANSEDSMTDLSSEGTSPQDNPNGFCLCVPEPKIPRPRNAFILYRQHQHAGVVAQHPGLPNPDISKIIGEQWRQLSPKDKNEWRALAEQEKARHSQQFPDYRYRPKRNGKFSSVDGSQALANLPTNCSKCGGKTMNPPHTPHYQPYEHGTLTPIVGMPRPPKRGHADAHVTHASRQPSMVQVAPPPYGVSAHYGYNPVHQPRRESVHYVTQPPPPPPPQQRIVLEDSESKRRRLNSSYPTRPAYDRQFYDRERPAYQRESISRPMPPPPVHRPSHPGPQSLPPRGSQPVQREDPNLTLPPLKTGVQPSMIISPKGHPPNSSTEAMIMSYSLLTKLKTLSSITPNLATSDQTCADARVRGVIIAIEGLDPRRVHDMTISLSEQLEKERKFYVRTFQGPNPFDATDLGRRKSYTYKRDEMSHAKYLNIMFKWHKMNQEVVDFVTHKPGKFLRSDDLDPEMNDLQLMPPNQSQTPQDEKHIGDELKDPCDGSGTRRSPISAVSPGTVEETVELALDTSTSKLTTSTELIEPSQSTFTRVTRSRIPQAALDSSDHNISECRSRTTQPPPPTSTHPITPPPPASPKSAESKTSNLIPVALIPHYQLTTVDTCSIALPITDNYDPITHWRWHATLWRGCTGPDISIIIQSNHEEEPESSSADAKRGPTLTHSDNNPSTIGNQTPGTMTGPQAPQPTSTPSQVPVHIQPHPKPQIPTSTNPVQPQQAHPPTHAPFSVDVRLQDYRAVIVRAGSSPSSSSSRNRNSSGAGMSEDKMLAKDNENWEKAKRRVGFEVEEWMRR